MDNGTIKARELCKLILLLLNVVILLTFAGCRFIVIGYPKGQSYVNKTASDVFGYDISSRESKTVTSPLNFLKKDKYYEFEDRHGIAFTYNSILKEQGIDSAVLFLFYENRLDYYYYVLPFYGDRLAEICENNGLAYRREAYGKGEYEQDVFGNNRQFSGFGIIAKDFNDIDKVANAVVEALDTCRYDKLKPNKKTYIATTNVNLVIGKLKKGSDDLVKFTEFDLLSDDEELPDVSDVKRKLIKDYVEAAKKYESFENDLPEGIIDSICPEIIYGVYNDKEYSQWPAKLLDDSDPENPVYEFKLKYKESSDGENYVYRDVYNNWDLEVYNFLAQLGASVFYEVGDGKDDIPGYNIYLGDDIYYVSFANNNGQKDTSKVIIEKNDKVYEFDTWRYTDADDEYKFNVTDKELEELFDINVIIDKPGSKFYVEKRDK